jgi:lipopolysaccharide transport system permease protein
MRLDLASAAADFGESFARPDLWTSLAWFDIKQRFRRSLLGPLWITLTMAALIGGMGPLYSSILGLQLSEYFPYLAIGIVVWSFFAALLTEAGGMFSAAAGIIRQTRFPLSSFALRCVWRNLIVFGMNNSIIMAVLLYAQPTLGWSVLWSAFGLLLVAVGGVGASLALGIFCTRFRDMQQMLVALLQIMMFLTPVFWKPSPGTERSIAVQWNPAFYLLELIRAPLLGETPEPRVVWISLAFCITLVAIGLALFARYRNRIVYWL